ncbi:toxin-antitoxin system YwqK family antitoxin [Bernardetia sp.]|uniref:toxin-antitoxin system YwqK family antitoxin n=1 Tax=Bernardetia sp. TaxID=1937974 RepID=UPI0025C1C576|nr:hypothetical protein [Bernardetia sp.]
MRFIVFLICFIFIYQVSFPQTIEEITLDSTNHYMIVENDTLPFVMSKVERLVYTKLQIDTMVYSFDSLPCPSFYRFENKIFNYYDANCKKQGVWIEEVIGRIWKGKYIEGKKEGIWKTIDKKNAEDYYEIKLFKDNVMTWSKIFYPNHLQKSYVTWERADSYYIQSIKRWYENGKPKEQYKCKLNGESKYYLPLKVYEIDTAYEWFESGQLKYIAIHKGSKKNYTYFYENGNIQINTICGVLGKNTRQITHYYESGNIKAINYFLATKKNYNKKIGIWEYYDEYKNLIKKVIYKKGKEKKTVYFDDMKK